MKICFLLFTIIGLFFFGCTKISPDTSIVLAVYTLGSGGTCTGATVSGRFVADTTLAAANTVTITVNVTVAGPYWITTDSANGMTFSKIGTFTAIGTQTAVLTGTGMPNDTGTVNFTIKPLNGPGGSCTFSIETVQGIPPTYYMTCLFNGVSRNFGDSTGATNSSIPGSSGLAGLDISGQDTVLNSKNKIEFGVESAGRVAPGIYSDTTSSRAYFNYVDSLGKSWSESISNQPSFTVNVISVNATNVTGSFSGIIKDQQGSGADSIIVTNGLFSVPLK
ncbi:MAG: hypothetical protein ABIY62_10010 [Ginsengibacter sp.]